MKPIDVTRLEELLAEALREAERIGVVPVTREDGLVLSSLAFTASSESRTSLVVDAGCGTGYSSLWLAAGMASACISRECMLVLIDRRSDALAVAERLVNRLVGGHVRVVARLGDALEILPELERPSLLFIDIEKKLYPLAVRMAAKIEAELVVIHNALYPPPPPELYEELRRGWIWTLVPTAPGLIIARRVS